MATAPRRGGISGDWRHGPIPEGQTAPTMRRNHMCHEQARYIVAEALFGRMPSRLLQEYGWTWCPGCRTWSTNDSNVVRQTVLNPGARRDVVDALMDRLIRNAASTYTVPAAAPDPCAKPKRSLDIGS